MASEAAVRKILQEIQEDPQLKYLNLGGLGLNDTDLEKIFSCINDRANIIGINLARESQYMPFGEKRDISQIFAEAFRKGDVPNSFTLASIKKIVTLRHIKYLRLCGNSIGDDAIPILASMPNLEELWVNQCNLTDAGIKHFLGFKKLNFLQVAGNKVSDALERKLEKHLGNNCVRHDTSDSQELENEKLEEKIIQILQKDDVTRLRVILRGRKNINARLKYGAHLLLLATERNALECSRFLLKSGAKIEDHEREYTPLFTAAEKGWMEMVKLLLKHGANIRGEFYFNSETAFSIAAFKFCNDFISVLRGIDFTKIIKLSFVRLYNNQPSLAQHGPCDELFEQYKRNGYGERDRTLVWFKDSIINHFNKLFRIPGLSPWVAFGQSKDLSFEYTQDCLLLYRAIEQEFPFLVDASVAGNIKNRKEIYSLLLEKFHVLQEKSPTESEDNIATDSETEENLIFDIQLLHKASKLRRILSKEELEAYIQQLNRELEEKDESQIDWSRYPKFYIALYRGIHYYRHHFSKQQRADHRVTSHLNRISPAPAVYYMYDLKVNQYQQARESDFKKGVEKVQQDFNTLLQSGNCKAYWRGSKQIFSNQSDMLQQRMSNSYHSFRKETENPKNAATQLLHDHKIIGYPHYATSDLSLHALKYAYGQKPVEGLKKWRLRPVFQASGKALHPYPGKVFISLLTPRELYQYNPRHVAGMHNREIIRLSRNVAPERETSIPGGIEAEATFYEELLRIPHFELYQEYYKQQYGIDEETFRKYQKDILRSWATEDEEERAKIRKGVKNEIIENSLIPHKEVELILVANREATRRGGYLIYKHLNGSYGLKPEGMRLPSTKDSSLTRHEKKLFETIDAYREEERKNSILQKETIKPIRKAGINFKEKIFKNPKLFRRRSIFSFNFKGIFDGKLKPYFRKLLSTTMPLKAKGTSLLKRKYSDSARHQDTVNSFDFDRCSTTSAFLMEAMAASSYSRGPMVQVKNQPKTKKLKITISSPPASSLESKDSSEQMIFDTYSLSSLTKSDDNKNSSSIEIINGKEISTIYWYEDSEMSRILDHFIAQRNYRTIDGKPVRILGPLDNISQYGLVEALNTNNRQRGVILIPFNLNRLHWIGLKLEYDNTGSLIQANYYDSQRNKMPDYFNSLLETTYREGDIITQFTTIEDYTLINQMNGHDCGPCTIENLFASIGFRELPDTNAVTRRLRHLELLKSVDPNFYNQFYERQRLNCSSFLRLKQNNRINSANQLDESEHLDKKEYEALLSLALEILKLPDNLPKDLKTALEPTPANKNSSNEEHATQLNKIRATLNDYIDNSAVIPVIRQFFYLRENSVSLEHAVLKLNYNYIPILYGFLSLTQKQVESDLEEIKAFLNNQQADQLIENLHKPKVNLNDNSKKRRTSDHEHAALETNPNKRLAGEKNSQCFASLTEEHVRYLPVAKATHPLNLLSLTAGRSSAASATIKSSIQSGFFNHPSTLSRTDDSETNTAELYDGNHLSHDRQRD